MAKYNLSASFRDEKYSFDNVACKNERGFKNKNNLIEINTFLIIMHNFKCNEIPP